MMMDYLGEERQGREEDAREEAAHRAAQAGLRALAERDDAERRQAEQARQSAARRANQVALRALVEQVAEAEPIVVCGVVEAACICTEPPGHTSPHVCQCGGSWSGGTSGDPEFTIHALPGSAKDYPSAIDILFGCPW